jgi:vacuolar protein sorting-associated protein 13A/C
MAGIATKVLSSLLGEYIEGLDKNNMDVGIWSGNVKIENVALKRDLSDRFNLPFDFKFNHVGRISAKIPWKSLSNSPVEIEFEDLLIIAQPKSQEDLMRIAINVFNDREKMLETFAANLEEKLKKGGKEESAGYFSGLITKIVDNVQVSIKNIHIRFECTLDKNCSFNFGITLDTLNIYTTDERGNKIFIDRSKTENAKLPVNKKLVLDDFSFYWNDKEMAPIADIRLVRNQKGMLTENPPLTADQKLKIINKLRASIVSGMGKKKDRVNDYQYLVNLSIDAKMIQYKKTQELIDRGIPEIEVTFNLDKISSVLSKGQFGQIMALMNYFSDYMTMAKKEQEKLRFKYLRPLKSLARAKNDTPGMRSQLRRQWWRFAYKAIKKEKQEGRGFFTVLRMDKKQKREYVERFKMLFSKIDFNSGKEYTTFLTQDEAEIYQVITLSLDEPSLKKAVEELLKEKQKLVKKESKKGWFSWGSSKEASLTDAEEKEIEDLINQVVKQEEDKFNTPDSFKWLKIRFIQREANVSLQRTNAQKQVESVDVVFSNFELSLMVRKTGLDVDLSLQNLEVTSKTEVSKVNVITDQIFRPLIETNPENRLVDLKLSTEPVGYTRKGQDKEEKLDVLLNLAIKSSEIFYNQKMINTLIDVFDNKAQMEALRKVASEQAEMVTQQSQQKLNDVLRTQKTVIVDIKIAAPLIILPFNQAEMVTSECWVMSPGILKIIGDNFHEDSRLDRAGLEHYDNFMIGLENIKIEYMPSILDYMETYTPSQIKNTKNKMIPNLIQNKAVLRSEGKLSSFPQFDLLKNFSITLDLNVLKPAYVQLNFKEPRFKVSAFISKLQVDLNQKIYSDTLRFGDIFKDSSASSPQLQMDKKSLLLSAAKYDSVIRGNTITGFSKVKDYAVLSQGRLYYFKDRKEQAAYDYFLLKDAKVKLLSPEESGHPFAIKIENGSGSQQLLAFENENSRTDWVVKIENECRKLRVQASQAAAASSSSPEGDSAPAEEGKPDQLKRHGQAAPEGPKVTHVAFVQLKMEELSMRVFNVNSQMFDFAISNLAVGVDVKDTETTVKVTLEKINILDTKEQDPNMKMLISSEIGSSIATKVQGLGVDSQYISKTLVNIDVMIVDPKSPKYEQVDTDIIINFGSLFVNLRPSQINRLMVFFVPASTEKPKEASPTAAESDSSSTANIAVVNRTKKLLNRENDKVIQIRVKFTLERISVIMVNEIKNIYLAHASVSAISIEFISKLTGMKLQGTLSNLQLHDLTNYPQTLTVCDFNKIDPTELFGISQKHDASSLIRLGFEKINSDIAELAEENVNGYLAVSIEQIQVNFYMQVIMRILDYALAHVLPALSTNSSPSGPDASKDSLQLSSTPANPSTTEEIALYNLKNPFWMKMEVNISQPIVILKSSPQYKESMHVELGNIRIQNLRIQNRHRVTFNNAHKRNKALELGDQFLGVWTETFFISMTELSIKKVVEEDQKDYYQYIMHPFNFNLSVEMVQYVEDYKILFNAETNQQIVYTDYSLKKKTTPLDRQHLGQFAALRRRHGRESPHIAHGHDLRQL